MPADPLASYFADLQAEYAKGVATEHSYRPALKTLLESIQPDRIREVTNEPKQIDCGAPDYLIARRVPSGPARALGHIEAKTIGVRLDDIERDSNRAEPTSREGRQFKRYREALPNLILTDYLDFRYYIDGKPHSAARIATAGSGKLAKDDAGMAAVGEMLTYFLTRQPEPITRADDLALRMAYLTRLIRERIVLDFEQGVASPLLRRWRDTLVRVLIADLNQPQHTGEFADMFAQTLAYGLFSARTMDRTPETFSRQEAQTLIPATNPFLRDFFYEITGPRLEEEGFVRFVDDLVALLAGTDMDVVLSTFGKRTRQEDPVIHFYETFLAAYDPKLREARGVYYTPEPVVQYIVRSVDHLLKTRFSLRDGLADRSMIQIQNRDPNLRVQGSKEMRKTRDVHRVLVLDPACGTGTFLYAMVDLIRQRFMQRDDAGDWSDYVRSHLLPRIFGFELLMAPYAVAHFKLGLQLAGRDLPEEERAKWAYNFSSNERLHVYLTNTLEEAHEYGNLPLFVEGVARESLEANEVKRELPIMVVMGNPPYSKKTYNRTSWIEEIMEDYKTTVRGAESQIQALSNDYIKFLRFAQWRIDQTKNGLVGMITGHGYLNGPQARDMRASLLGSFQEIYVLNLHGSVRRATDLGLESRDDPVFQIQQGTAIILAVKNDEKNRPARVYYADLKGALQDKFDLLNKNDVSTISWSQVEPTAPFYFFVPFNAQEEYQALPDLPYIFGTGDRDADMENRWATGFTSQQDQFAIAFDDTELETRIAKLLAAESEAQLRSQFRLCSSGQWSYARARLELANGLWRDKLASCTYRPFDTRRTVFDRNVVSILRSKVTEQLREHSNLGFISSRVINDINFAHISVSKLPVDKIYLSSKTSTNAYVFPLYIYPDGQQTAFDTSKAAGKGGRRPNLSPAFTEDVSARIGLRFIQDGKGDLTETFGPEDVFNYMYAVFHSPTYRQRYAEFLKIDFPRLPLTSDLTLFKTLIALGERLVALHLMEADGDGPMPSFPVAGDNRVEAVRYTPPTESGDKGRVYINQTQYFEGVPVDVWEFHIGGYKVTEKWLKDRRGRELTYDDRRHYKGIITALGETERLMQEIDEAIPEWPLK